ncbi:DUF6528 family protein [Kitasatospora sp. NPDC094015]|uniref:DUF6528 family protein n=1 Tax=Kitasatospora sp. NPDC094015 TaxID=3155205 RepID=UPI00332AA13F
MRRGHRTRRTLLAAAVVGSVALCGPAAARPRPDGPVVVVDQAARAVLVLGSAEDLMAYRGPGSLPVVRSWSADRDPGLADLSPGFSWTNPSEARSRVLRGRRYLLATASGGLAVVVEDATDRVYWATDTGLANPHGLDLLPDGNVAVAASTGGWIRLYTASRGPRSDRFAAYPLAGAHGVHWDPQRRLLWALGSTELTALRVGGTAAAPTLSAVRSTPLPSAGGHDLSPVLASPGRYWVSTETALWEYDPDADRFAPVRLSGGGRGIKSIGDAPGTGRVLTASPEPGNACTWCTTVLALHRPDGSRVLTGTRLYKARWFTDRRR